jgi:hypothetical protein
LNPVWRSCESWIVFTLLITWSMRIVNLSSGWRRVTEDIGTSGILWKSAIVRSLRGLSDNRSNCDPTNHFGDQIMPWRTEPTEDYLVVVQVSKPVNRLL